MKSLLAVPLLTKGLHKKHSLQLTVLPYYLPPSLRPFYTSVRTYTTHNYLVYYASPGSLKRLFLIYNIEEYAYRVAVRAL